MYDGQLSSRPLTASERDQDQFAMLPEVGVLRNANKFGLNVYVGGPSGSGKTTLLRHMEYYLRGSTAFVRAEEAETPSELVAAIASAVSPPGSGPVAMGGTELDVTMIHKALLSWEVLPGKPKVVLLDGANREQVQTLFGRYRDSLWELPLTWMVSGPMSAPLPPANAFFDRIVHLGAWPKEQIRELMDKRIEQWVPTGQWRDDWRDRIASAIAPASPLRVMRIMQAIVDSRDSVRLIDSLDRERDRAAELSDRLRSVYEALNETGPTHAGDGQLMNAVGVSRSRIAHSLKELEELDMVSAERDGRRVTYTSLLYSLLSRPATS